jgi:transcriptional regulator with PAS, ATPase and Fis domain
MPNKTLGSRHRLMIWIGENVESRSLPRLGTLVLGRGADVQIRISAPSISRRHVAVSVEESGVYVRDLGSQNGTRLNGERIADRRALSYGDVLTVGEVFVIFSEAPADESQAAELTPRPEEIERTLLLGETPVLVSDPSMCHVYAQIERLAPSDLSVLIWGETGTGKELAATALHLWSKRAAGPFVAINCAALPEALAESELFGHVRGAFSGAVVDKPGLLESASGGTAFLDEIGDLPMAIQSKLLRVLEARTITRLGAVQERKIDIRVVAASHQRLDLGVKHGWFREDLFYRLNVAFLSLPPLRSRPRDVGRLAQRFLGDARRALDRGDIALGPDVLAHLMRHRWPGNIRELKNLMEYLAVTHGDDPIELSDVVAVLESHGTSTPHQSPPGITVQPFPAVSPPPSLSEATRQHERQRLESTLAVTGGNRTKAARLLGVPLRTFMAKIKKHGIR